MFNKINPFEGVATGIIFSFIIGIVAVFIFEPTFNSIIFILSIAVMPGFFLMTLFYWYKIKNEKIAKANSKEGFDWGVEVNLRKLQVMHQRYVSLIQSMIFIATGSLISMVYLASQFPMWTAGHQIFFPICCIIFISAIHLVFRWWMVMREDYKHLKFERV